LKPVSPKLTDGATFATKGKTAGFAAGGAALGYMAQGNKNNKMGTMAIAAAGGAAVANISGIMSVLGNGATIAKNSISSMSGKIACSDYQKQTRIVAEGAAVFRTFTGKIGDFKKAVSKVKQDEPKAKSANDALTLLEVVYTGITVKSAAQFIPMKAAAEAATAASGTPAQAGFIASFEAQKVAAAASIAALIPSTINAINKVEDAEKMIKKDAAEAKAFLDDYAAAVPNLVNNEGVIASNSPEAGKLIVAAEAGAQASTANAANFGTVVAEPTNAAKSAPITVNATGRAPAAVEESQKTVFGY
jgi:hypothetical protein